MCVIVYGKVKDMVKQSHDIQNCHLNNSQGIGIAFRKDNTLKFSKGLRLDKLTNILAELVFENTETMVALHFRRSKLSDYDYLNHPYSIQAPDALNGSGCDLLMQNGLFSHDEIELMGSINGVDSNSALLKAKEMDSGINSAPRILCELGKTVDGVINIIEHAKNFSNPSIFLVWKHDKEEPNLYGDFIKHGELLITNERSVRSPEENEIRKALLMF